MTTKTISEVSTLLHNYCEKLGDYPCQTGFLQATFMSALISVHSRHPETFNEIVQTLEYTGEHVTNHYKKKESENDS